MVSVDQARVLPPSFFNSRLTTDALDFGHVLPTTGWVRIFHPLGRTLTRRTIEEALRGCGALPFYSSMVRGSGRSMIIGSWSTALA